MWSPCCPRQLCPWASSVSSSSSSATAPPLPHAGTGCGGRDLTKGPAQAESAAWLGMLWVLQMTQVLHSGRDYSTVTQRKHSQSSMPWEDLLHPRQKCQAALQG